MRKTKEKPVSEFDNRVPRPTIGRIVHYYDHSLPEGGHHGGGHGPYAAIVTAVHPGSEAQTVEGEDGLAHDVGAVAETIDLTAFPPVAVPFRATSVPYLAKPLAADGVPEASHHYWTGA